MRWQWLGRVDYLDAVRRMEALRARILDGDGDAETLLLVAHEPVITLGRRARAENVLASEAALAARGVTVARSSRGGDGGQRRGLAGQGGDRGHREVA